MSARLKVRNDDGDLEEITLLPREGWTVEESAEEGNSSGSTIYIPDPDKELTFTAHRRWVLFEDESEGDNDVLASGFLSRITVARKGGEFYEPLGRVHTLQLVDMNTLWENRLQRGTDTDRDPETDVERVTWLAASEEMGYFDDTTYLSSASPVNLDGRDVARQSSKSVIDECSQQSGKNYWIYCYGTWESGSNIGLWYGSDALEVYDSPLRLSNDPNDWVEDELADGTSLVWPIADATSVEYSGERIYDGVFVEYEGGSVYRKKSATSAFFTLSGRDLSYPAPEIKSKAKAQARGDRVLNDCDEMDEVLTTTVRLPKGKASMIRAGMRIPVKATHSPGWENFGWARVLTCSYTPVQGGAFYDLGLKLQGPTTFIPIDTVTLEACNTVVEDGGRNAVDESASRSFTAGEVWRYTLTQSSHDGQAVTDSLLLSATTVGPAVIEGWGANFGFPGWPTGAPDQGFPPPTSAIALSGTFAITSTGTGTFKLQCKAGYYGGPPVVVDECWNVTLERLS